MTCSNKLNSKDSSDDRNGKVVFFVFVATSRNIVLQRADTPATCTVHPQKTPLFSEIVHKAPKEDSSDGVDGKYWGFEMKRKGK